MDVTFFSNVKCDTVPSEERYLTQFTVRHLIDVLSHHPEPRREWSKLEALYFRDSAAGLGPAKSDFLQEIHLKLQKHVMLDSHISCLFRTENVPWITLYEAGILPPYLRQPLLKELLLVDKHLLFVHLQYVEGLVCWLFVYDLKLFKIYRKLEECIKLRKSLNICIHRMIQLYHFQLVLV